MEKTISAEEKIRRAEEIYLRRRNGYSRRNVATVNVGEEKNYGLLKKMMLQIAICMVIYFIFYLIQNSNYIFSENVLNTTKEILSYDIDFASLYSQVSNYINMNETTKTDLEKIEDAGLGSMKAFEKIQNSNPAENADNIDNADNTQNSNSDQSITEANGAIGGAEQEAIIEEEPTTDEGYIKKYFSFIKPIEGIVTSEFGPRNSTNPIVSKNHTGIDIAANTGTIIKAAMDGTVSESSGEGDYGNHIKIINGDITTVYAHCSKLYVNKGDKITQGQEIAEVGSTGNSTGPHLHFEIRRGSTYINPRSILEF